MVSVQIQRKKKRPWTQLVEEGHQAREERDNAQWRLGDLANEVETHYGEQDLQKYADEVGVSYDSLRYYKVVSKKFEFVTRVTFLLPWSYFRTVVGLDLPTAMALLKEAKEKGWTRRELEAAVKQLRPEEEKIVECDLCDQKLRPEEIEHIRLCWKCSSEFQTWLNLKRVRIEGS